MEKTSEMEKKSQVAQQVKKSFRGIKISGLLSFIPYVLFLIKFFLHIDAEVTTTFCFSGRKSLTMGSFCEVVKESYDKKV